MSEQAAQTAEASQSTTTSTETTSTEATSETGLGGAAPQSGLTFIPESYRNSSWATKYKTPDDFFKGVDGMAQMIGKKEIIQGIQVPGEGATEEDYQSFFAAIGRPESPDKYQLPDPQQLPEGYDISSEKSKFLAAAHRAGLNQKQALIMFNESVNEALESHKAEDAKVAQTFDAALKKAFPSDTKSGFDMAKRGAKALGIADTLDQEGLSLNPTVLQICAKLGELAGEDSFVSGSGKESKESLLDEAKKIQMSAAYVNGDKALHSKVAGIYKRVYG